ncbi:MAG TPA: GAF domain-containing protein [Thermodesulfobacteriaceae bacterium]|nr:GAF domain-containing protein [Thermodesulfobacteriaceae bacterium]
MKIMGYARQLKEIYDRAFLSRLRAELEELKEIDLRLEQKDVLEKATGMVVKFMDADAIALLLCDSESLELTRHGVCRIAGSEGELSVSFRGAVAKEIVHSGKSVVIPDIKSHPDWMSSNVSRIREFNSLLAVPVNVRSMAGDDYSQYGILQIFFKEQHRDFDELEIMHAEILAVHLGELLEKKRLQDAYRINLRKEEILDSLFTQVSIREGVKLKDLFLTLIRELRDCLKVTGCTLFSVCADRRFVRLEAAYPMDITYHAPGYTFTVSHHPYFKAILQEESGYGDYPYERICSSYMLIKDPQKSSLVTRGLKDFARKHSIHSILMVPVRVRGTIRFLMTFYVTDMKPSFLEEEIELLTFFGKEIMKASRLEILDDVIHDFKNPAIAIIGFSKRARKLLESEDLESARKKLTSYLDIVLKETARLQDMVLTMNVTGREEVLDLNKIAASRFRINKEAIREAGLSAIRVEAPVFEPGLMVYCSRFGLERVLDNLLNNATKAVPEQGGNLSMRSYREGDFACLEIVNAGEIPADQIEQVKKGEVKGRGLNIIYRFIQANHGGVDIRVDSGNTIFTVKIPIYQAEAWPL